MLGVEELKGIHLGSLCEALCQCVQVAGSPDHHDLARMETALKSILNITSRYTCHIRDRQSFASVLVNVYMYLWPYSEQHLKYIDEINLPSLATCTCRQLS